MEFDNGWSLTMDGVCDVHASHVLYSDLVCLKESRH